jgi:hypothetical protein
MKVKRKTLQRGGLSLPGVPGASDIMQQVKDTAKQAVTTAISENPITAQIAGVTETMKGVVQKVTDAPELIKGVVQQTVAEQMGQPLTGNAGQAYPAEGEAAAQEEYPLPEEGAAETWFGGGSHKRGCTCYRGVAAPRRNVLMKRRPKSRKRKASRKSSKRHSRRRRS